MNIWVSQKLVSSIFLLLLGSSLGCNSSPAPTNPSQNPSPVATPTPNPSAKTSSVDNPPAGTSSASPNPTGSVAQLNSYEWNLTRALDAKGQPISNWQSAGKKPIQLIFKDQRLSIQNLCNVISAPYSLEGARLKLGDAISTKRACSEKGLMDLEQRVHSQIASVQNLEIQSGATPTLLLSFADGSRWELTGAPTPATRYGSEGEQMFLEVAPKKVSCHHPLGAKLECLSVREIQFGEDGTKKSTGDWYNLFAEIEGFQFSPGLRTVLRLKRFPAAKPGEPIPQDAPKYKYVLDMVIESETIR